MSGKINKEFIVTSGLFLFFGEMVYMASGLHPMVRFFPLVVCIPILVIIIIQLAASINVRVDAVLNKYFKKESLSQTAKQTSQKRTSFKSELFLFIWLMLLYLAFDALGILLSTVLFLFLFLKLVSKQPWKTTIGIILGVSGFIYLIFSALLEMDLFAGLLL